MRLLVGFTVVLTIAGSGFAQGRVNYTNPTPVLTGGVGSVVFPAGTPANYPGIQRFTPNVIHPAGGGPHLVIPNATNGSRPVRRNNSNGFVYGYPVYVGSYGSVYDGSAYVPPVQETPQQPNITIVMPPQAPPVIINQFAPTPHPQMSVYEPEPAPAAEAQPAEATHYLLAFKDHTIYSAIAYWVDGDTLHYFTAGNTHNQVSVSLVDRAVTERLNRDAGVEVKLPKE